MNKLRHIPIALIIIVNTVYDFFAPLDSTHWHIFFFSFMYLSYTIWAFREIDIKQKFTPDNIYFGVIGIALFSKIVLEIEKWNLPFDDYYSSINNIHQSILFAILICVVLLIVASKIKALKH